MSFNGSNEEKKIQIKFKLKNDKGETKSTSSENYIRNNNTNDTKEEQEKEENDKDEINEEVEGKEVHEEDKKNEEIKEEIEKEDKDEEGIKTFGSITLISLGKINFENQNFHTDRYIFPIGFKTQKMYQSYLKLNQKCTYTCEILEDENTHKPLFKVTCEGKNF
jgi:hypothetical protein